MSDFSKLKTIAQAYSDLIDSEDRDSWAEASAEYEFSARVDVVLDLISGVELLKSNNADMILRNKILRERPDLKPDRIACHSSVVSIQNDLLKLKQENESLKKDAARYRWLRDNDFDIGSFHPAHEHNHQSWFEYFDDESIDYNLSMKSK